MLDTGARAAKTANLSLEDLLIDRCAAKIHGNGAKVHEVYDAARTPYKRLVEAGVFTGAKRQELVAIYHSLNPVLLLKQINENLECLWRLAECPIWRLHIFV